MLTVLIVIHVLTAIARWRLLSKAGDKGWKALIPFYGGYCFQGVIWQRGAFWLRLLLLAAIALTGHLGGLWSALTAQGGFILPKTGVWMLLCYAFLLSLYALEITQALKTARAFGRGDGYMAGLVIAPPLFMLLLSLGDCRYIGPEGREVLKGITSDISDLEYLKLGRFSRRLNRLDEVFRGIPGALWRGIKGIGLSIAGACKKFAASIMEIVTTFKNGDTDTRISYLVMGWGSIRRGQILRGILFLLFEVVFVVYMIFWGGHWLSLLPSLGKQGPTEEYDFIFDTYITHYHDNSFKILLYGVLTIFFIIAFIYTWRVNVKQNKLAQQILSSGKKLKSGKDDLRSLVDDNFHRTLLALPMTGIIVFTVLPIFFMILVAFTNYDGTHNGFTNNLFHWVGLDNFNTMLSWTSNTQGGTQSYAATFGEVLSWTLIWAFFATFTNYFLGMLVAMAINKKGIKFKKVFRTILVMTIAIPQFISLLYVSKMFAKNGIVNGFLMDMGWIKTALPFWEKATWARITVIIINIWIGIPYLMLMATGILMNIPQDLYESARIDGASPWQQYSKITLPYMLFITGPYLLTSFTGNMNNFNVIYLLTGGAPTNSAASSAAGNVGYTDLLITWLFKITTGAESQYYLASVVGIMVFVVVSLITLIVYRALPSIKNEEDFQ